MDNLGQAQLGDLSGLNQAQLFLARAHSHIWGHSWDGQDPSPCGLLPSVRLVLACSVLEAFLAQDQKPQGFQTWDSHNFTSTTLY